MAERVRSVCSQEKQEVNKNGGVEQSAPFLFALNDTKRKTEETSMPKPTRGGRNKNIIAMATAPGPQKVGKLSAKVASVLGLMQRKNQPIMFGDSNREHMKRKHPEAYKKYGKHIPQIISHPDYVGLDDDDGSIEYVKEFKVDGAYVKVAVRADRNDSTLFARSIYVLKPSRVENAIKTGKLKRV